MDTEVAVVGGGAVGLAIAAELSRSKQVAVVERHGGLGLETRSHNSGVIHAGLYYPTGALKHTFCLEGNHLLYEWAADHGARAQRPGKLIIAVDANDLAGLDAIAGQAAANGVRDIRMIASERELRDLEPSVRCVAALWSGTTGVVDQSAFILSPAACEANGGWIALKHDVSAIERTGSGFELHMGGEQNDEDNRARSGDLDRLP